ncbi:ATP-binding protein [Kitasatospora sp. MBT63]|uniref:ATP-binding protein n=1 Tax=Kitasatospora sp. MBT63 TaxID=1444768 RepID=UPI000A8D19A5
MPADDYQPLITHGTGKTHLATGLAVRACLAGRLRHRRPVGRPPRCRPPGRPPPGRAVKLGRYPLIVIDEVAYIPFESEAANLFFQVISNRYERASVIVTSNKPFGKAHMFRRTRAWYCRNFMGSGGGEMAMVTASGISAINC